MLCFARVLLSDFNNFRQCSQIFAPYNSNQISQCTIKSWKSASLFIAHGCCISCVVFEFLTIEWKLYGAISRSPSWQILDTNFLFIAVHSTLYGCWIFDRLRYLCCLTRCSSTFLMRGRTIDFHSIAILCFFEWQ